MLIGVESFLQSPDQNEQSNQEVSLMIAALRHFQNALSLKQNLAYLDDIINTQSISLEDIDHLCESINFGGSTIPESPRTTVQQPSEYLVRWSIDVDAPSPTDAAKQARSHQIAHATQALVFDVIDHHGNTTTVDLCSDESSCIYGLEQALNDLSDDDELNLYEVEVGLLDISDDPNTPFDTRLFVVAALNKHLASQLAIQQAEQTIPVVNNVTFSNVGEPAKVEASSYDQHS